MIKQDFCTFETSDLNLAAFLRANKVNFVGTKKDRNRTYFLFDDPRTKALVLSFFNDGQVSVSDFTKSVNELKTIIFEGVHV